MFPKSYQRSKEVKANVATIKGKFKRGSSSKSKAGPSKYNRKIEKKGKGMTPQQNKGKKTAEKGKCYHCGENGHWLRNCLKYLAQKKAEKEAQGKMTKRYFTGKGFRAKTPLELVHLDLCGSMNVKDKSDSFEKFKEYKAEVENESGKTIKTFRSDRGGEYMDLRFQDYLINHGIQSQLSAPSTPQ
ncbi:gag/pol protein [Cucumis melo var. makuwa]|uniref:Gag/pol protein n=1 Tax=Cucumis melo var. makuwa TaxID=1194695 RepID=A0A5A7UCC3_CUCMM|nr:gag/pol protein [Cucumis melo var. makuwa]